MPANYVLLERIELNASVTSVTFANIPQTGYTDLKVVASVRTSNASGTIGAFMQFNGLATNIYSGKAISGNGASVSSYSPSNSSPYSGVTGDMNANSYTASIYSNSEFYIPNYNSTTTYKSYSVDAVTENNATTAYTSLAAGLASTNAAITSITMFPYTSGDSILQYSTFSLYGLAALGTTPAIAPKATGGNIIDYDGTYFIHTFLTSGTFTPQTTLSCEYLVVAGGGGGGGNRGGGGGAGGYRTATGFSVATSPTSVIVGAGGAAGAATPTRGTSGTDSSFSSITATGGGGGGAGDSVTGANNYGFSGGSGGGSAWNGIGSSNIPGGAGNTPSTSPSQGNNGGLFTVTGSGSSTGGGGGGASAVGTAGDTNLAASSGTGGAGTSSSISGTSIAYAGGGGGGNGVAGVNAPGGTGGGGAGGQRNTNDAVAGTLNRGGGGGGGGTGSASYAGAAGGSGIVIIRYLA